jgi:ketosteroid isomerase-like protein
MPQEDDRVKAARRLFAAIEAGDTGALLSLYDENAVQVEHPNSLKPKGDRRTPAAMAEALGRGKKLLSSERYEILNAVSAGDGLALQVRWTGVVAVPVGALQAGEEMVCESGIFMRFSGEKIAEQHNYDCFADFMTPRG